MVQPDPQPGPPVNRAVAQRIATRLFGAEPALRWIRSDEVDVFIASFNSDNDLPDKVIKLDRPGKGVVAQEQRLLPFLRDAGVDVAPIEHAGLEPGADVPGSAVEAVAFNVQPFLERRHIGAIYAEGPGAARDIADRLGRSVARLHALPPAEVPGGADAESKRYWVTRWWVSEHQKYEPFLRDNPRYQRVCARAVELLARLPTHFGNGQWYQCRFDGRGAFAIIDWGTCGTLWPMYDLAMALRAMRAWCTREQLPEGSQLSQEDLAQDLVPRVVAAYLGDRTPADAELDELALWQAHHALSSAIGDHLAGQPARASAMLARVEQFLAERPGALG